MLPHLMFHYIRTWYFYDQILNFSIIGPPPKTPFSIPQRNCVIIKLRHHYFHHIITSPYYHLILVSRHLIFTSRYYCVILYHRVNNFILLSRHLLSAIIIIIITFPRLHASQQLSHFTQTHLQKYTNTHTRVCNMNKIMTF